MSALSCVRKSKSCFRSCLRTLNRWRGVSGLLVVLVLLAITSLLIGAAMALSPSIGEITTLSTTSNRIIGLILTLVGVVVMVALVLSISCAEKCRNFETSAIDFAGFNFERADEEDDQVELEARAPNERVD